jgi:hypothetical protein
MSKFTFICEDDPCPFGESITTKRTFEFDAVHLEGIINEFETFLRGCGFHLNGYLEIVEPNQKIVEDEDLDEYTESLFDKK